MTAARELVIAAQKAFIYFFIDLTGSDLGLPGGRPDAVDPGALSSDGTTILGVGTVEFLSGSAAGSMGHLKFEALPDPEEFRSRVQDQLSTRNLGGR